MGHMVRPLLGHENMVIVGLQGQIGVSVLYYHLFEHSCNKKYQLTLFLAHPR